MFCRFLYLCTSPLCCLFFFHLRILITHLVFSNSSCPLFYDSSNDVVYFVFHSITVRTVWYILFFIWWQFKRCRIFCFPFYDSSNGVIYFVFHFISVRTMWYILFFILWQFERCGIFCFSFDDSSSGVVYIFFRAVRFTRSLVLCACFVDFCPFVLFHCIVCSSSIDGFWLPIWYFQTLLAHYFMTVRTVLYILFFIL